MSSVLFGTKTYDPGQVIAVILRERKPGRVRFEIRTRDESLFRVNNLKLETDSILLQDPPLAGLRLPAEELVAMRRAEN